MFGLFDWIFGHDSHYNDYDDDNYLYMDDSSIYHNQTLNQNFDIHNTYNSNYNYDFEPHYHYDVNNHYDTEINNYNTYNIFESE